MPIYVIDQIKQKNAAEFPLIEDSDFKGSLRIVADATARDAIPAGYRKAGMFAVTQDDNKLWQLGIDLLAWDEWTPGAGSNSKPVILINAKSEPVSVSIPTSVGAAYIDANEVPSVPNTVKYRVIMESTSGSAGYEAYMDLYDINGVLNSGVPDVVSGSQIDTGTGSPPPGGPTPNQLIPSAYETDVSTAFEDLSAGGPGVFEARLWIGVEGGGNAVVCKSAELIFTKIT
jgi:hypothetical protein